MKRILLLLVFPLLLLPAPIAAGPGPAKDVRYVSVGATRLLSGAKAFSKPLASLDAGDAVVVLGKSGAYLLVEVGGKKGWLPERALATERPKIGASSSRKRDASSEEIAAATKGFSSEVEAEYADSNPQLDYEALDRLEKRTAVADPVGSLEAFRKDGKIGEFAEGRDE